MINKEDQMDIVLKYSDNIESLQKRFMDATKSQERMIKILDDLKAKSNATEDKNKRALYAFQEQQIKRQIYLLGHQTKLRETALRSQRSLYDHLFNQMSKQNQLERSGFNILEKRTKEIQQAVIAAEQLEATEKAISRTVTKTRSNRPSQATGSGTQNGKAGFYETVMGESSDGKPIGTSFGHKLATTAQYATAGAVIYKVAQAFSVGATAVTEFDQAIRTMSAVLGESMITSKALGDQLNDVGKAYGGAQASIYATALALGRAGVATKDLVDGTKVVVKMARLTGDTFEQSASAIISYTQVFDQYDVTTLGDKLAYVANASRLSTQDIGTFSNYALAAAKDVGLTVDAVGGLAIAFSNAGVNASTIGTQIRRFTSLLSDNGKVTVGLFDRLGIIQKNFVHDLRASTESSNTAMEGFATKLRSLSDTEFAGLISGMDLLARNSLQLIRNNSTAFIDAMKHSYSGAKGELESINVIIEGSRVSWERLGNTISDVAVDIANYKNATSKLTTGLTTLAEGFGVLFGTEAEKNIIRARMNLRLYNLRLEDGNLSIGERVKLLTLQAEAAQKLARLEKGASTESAKEIAAKKQLEHTAALLALGRARMSGDKERIKAAQEIVNKLELQTKGAKAVNDQLAFAKKGFKDLDIDTLGSNVRSLIDYGADYKSSLSTFNKTLNAQIEEQRSMIEKVLSGFSEKGGTVDPAITAALAKKTAIEQIAALESIVGLEETQSNLAEKLASQLTIIVGLRTKETTILSAIKKADEQATKEAERKAKAILRATEELDKGGRVFAKTMEDRRKLIASVAKAEITAQQATYKSSLKYVLSGDDRKAIADIRLSTESKLIAETERHNKALAEGYKTGADIATLESKHVSIKKQIAQEEKNLLLQQDYRFKALSDGISSMKSGMEDFFDFTSDGWADFGALANNILMDVYKSLVRNSVIAPITSGLSELGGSFLGDLFSSYQAQGGAWNNGTQFFATGGVVNRATPFGMSNGKTGVLGEAGPEAILPLQRSGSGNLGVASRASNVILNITNASGQAIEAENISDMLRTNQRGEEERVINIVIKHATTNANFRSIMKGM